MRKSENKKRKSRYKLPVFLGIIWAIMLIVYCVSVYKIFHYDSVPYYSNPEYLMGDVTLKQYGNIYQRVDDMLSSNLTAEELPEYTELVAIHDYIEAAGLYRIYSENGLDELADRNKERMESAKAGFGKLSFAIEEIDEAIGLTE